MAHQISLLLTQMAPYKLEAIFSTSSCRWRVSADYAGGHSVLIAQTFDMLIGDV